tara:strand:+ start:702 stop:827 length:126 start_codon:yes stop_codon:yes gene_type:complete
MFSENNLGVEKSRQPTANPKPEKRLLNTLYNKYIFLLVGVL